jgi:hypothetical protein
LEFYKKKRLSTLKSSSKLINGVPHISFYYATSITKEQIRKKFLENAYDKDSISVVEYGHSDWNPKVKYTASSISPLVVNSVPVPTIKTAVQLLADPIGSLVSQYNNNNNVQSSLLASSFVTSTTVTTTSHNNNNINNSNNNNINFNNNNNKNNNSVVPSSTTTTTVVYLPAGSNISTNDHSTINGTISTATHDPSEARTSSGLCPDDRRKDHHHHHHHHRHYHNNDALTDHNDTNNSDNNDESMSVSSFNESEDNSNDKYNNDDNNDNNSDNINNINNNNINNGSEQILETSVNYHQLAYAPIRPGDIDPAQSDSRLYHPYRSQTSATPTTTTTTIITNTANPITIEDNLNNDPVMQDFIGASRIDEDGWPVYDPRMYEEGGFITVAAREVPNDNSFHLRNENRRELTPSIPNGQSSLAAFDGQSEIHSKIPARPRSTLPRKAHKANLAIPGGRSIPAMQSPETEPTIESPLHGQNSSSLSTSSSLSLLSTTNGDDNCVVCMDASKNHLIMPCRHLCVCTHCAPIISELGTCPMCRTRIKEIIQIFK